MKLRIRTVLGCGLALLGAIIEIPEGDYVPVGVLIEKEACGVVPQTTVYQRAYVRWNCPKAH